MGGTSLYTREALGAPAPVGARSGVGSCGNGGPGEAQRQRVRRGEEEQRSDCAFRPQGGNKGCGACDDEGGGLLQRTQSPTAPLDYSAAHNQRPLWNTHRWGTIPPPPYMGGTSLYTREALVHTFRHCSPLTLGFPGAPKLRRPRRALPLYTIIDIPHCKNRHWPFPVKCGKIKGNTAQLRLRALAVLFPHKSAAKTLKYTKYSGVFATNL